MYQKSIGGTGGDYGQSVARASGNDYVVVGSTAAFGAGGEDLYLIKVNANGDTLWTKTYGGSAGEYGSFVTQTNDGGFIISGYTESFGAAGRDAYLVKTDAAGNAQWSKHFGVAGNDYGNIVLQAADSGFICIGTSENLGAGFYDMYVIRTDADGDTLWTRTYGGSQEEDGNSIYPTSDGGFILAGITRSFGAGNEDIYIVKIDSHGDTLWTKAYGGAAADYGFSIIQTDDDGYMVNGTTSSFGINGYDCYLLRLDSMGAVMWCKTYASPDYETSFSVIRTNDNGYAFLGQSYGFGTASDIYLVKTDIAGDTLWTRIYGGSGYEFESRLLQTPDGGYLFSGGEESFGADRNLFLVRTDANGHSGCHEGNTNTIVSTVTMPAWSTATEVSSGGNVFTAATITARGGNVNTMCTTISVEEMEAGHSLSVYPNPFADELTLKGSDEKGVAAVFDLFGKELIRVQCYTGETKINAKELPAGFYVLSYSYKHHVVNLKLVRGR